MRFKWYSLDKEPHSCELKVKQQRAKGCEVRPNSLADNIKSLSLTNPFLKGLKLASPRMNSD